MSAGYYKPAQPCEIASCWTQSTFTVEHPQRGEIDVCASHARRIDNAFDSVKVEL